MNTIPNEPTCPRCGKPVSPTAFEGLCPECLMRAGFGTVTGKVGEEKLSAFVPPTPEELAKHFPQLEILELLGRGGMGAVYKARQTHLDRVVALKILPPSVSHAPSFAERFVREAKALAKLHHPNIVTLYESGQADELFYFLMEFVDGMNLRELLSAGTISPKDALAIVPQICDALQFAHDRGIVHRDIKPENILLSKTGQVKIADFGVAKLVAGDFPESSSHSGTPSEGTQTEVGKVIGTPQYMAPEQITRPLEVDNRADIYALGVVFYQMLTGELPVGRFDPPSTKVQIDVRLDEVVLRALEKRPELRYQQASALKTQVETIATTRGALDFPHSSSPLPPAGNSSSIGHYLLLLLRWLGVAFAVFVLTVLGGVFIADLVQPKVYVATAQIQVVSRGVADPAVLQSEVEIIQSPDVLQPVINDLALDKIWARQINRSGADALSSQDALAYMHKILVIDIRRGTSIIDITASSNVPKEAADIANAVTDKYKINRDVEADQFAKRGEDSIRDQIIQQQKVVDDKKAQVAKMQQDLELKGVKIPPDATDMVETELDARKKDLLAAQEDSNARQVLLEKVSTLPDDQFLSALDGLGRQQPDIAALRTDISKMEADLVNLLNDGFTEGHPRIVAMRAELAAKKKQLADLVAGVRTAMNIDADMAKSRVVLLQNELNDLAAKLNDQGSTLAPFRDAQRQLDQQQNLLDALNVRLKQVAADSGFRESPVRIISRAEPPEYPAKPNRALDLVISMIVGIFLSVVTASIVEFLIWRASAKKASSRNSPQGSL